MQLVKDIINAIQNGERTETGIKMKVKGYMRDYGTTNSTLRRLCSHEILQRNIAFNKKTGRYCYHYNLNVDTNGVRRYIAEREELVRQHKYNRLVKAGVIQKMEDAPVSADRFYIEVNDWQPAKLIVEWIENKGYKHNFGGDAENGARYYFLNNEWQCMSRREIAHYAYSDNQEMSLKDFIERADTRWSNEGKPSEYFQFDDAQHLITRNFDSSKSPLGIGDGLAPNGMELKCLIVNSEYKLEVIEHAGSTIIAFKKK